MVIEVFIEPLNTIVLYSYQNIVCSSPFTKQQEDRYDRYDADRGEFIEGDQFDVRNPVIQRLTSNNGALRNESYYKVGTVQNQREICMLVIYGTEM